MNIKEAIENLEEGMIIRRKHWPLPKSLDEFAGYTFESYEKVKLCNIFGEHIDDSSFNLSEYEEAEGHPKDWQVIEPCEKGSEDDIALEIWGAKCE